MTGRRLKHQTIFYDGYWRTDCKVCSQCQVTRPIAEFSRRAEMPTGLSSSCRHCHRQYRKTRTEAHRLYEREYRARNKEREYAKYRRYKARVGREAFLARKKLTDFLREERNGMSDFLRKRRTREGYCASLAESIRRTHDLPCTAAQAREAFMDNETFIKLHRAWRKSGYSKGICPVIRLKPGRIKAQSLADFTFVTYRQLFAIVAKKHRRLNYEKTTTVRADSCRRADAGFERGHSGHTLPSVSNDGCGAAQANEEVGERQVSMEAKG